VLGQAALVAVSAIAIGVLFGSVLATTPPTVSGTLTGSQSAEPTVSGEATPTSAEPSTADPAPPSMDAPTTDLGPAPPTMAAPAPVVVHFASCAVALAAGVSMIPYGDPQYSPDLDHDGDGIACDQHGDPPTRYRPPPAAPPCTCPR
jgi:hypothetical protein